MARVRDKSQIIGEFIDWLAETKNVHLAHYPTVCRVRGTCPDWEEGICNPKNCNDFDEDQDRLTELSYRTEDLLAEFFEIDLKKVEEERRALLDFIREEE